jgi:signal transduction histidine kinase
MGIAIHQSQLYEQAQKFNAELEHQVQVRTQQLRQALDFAAVLKQITEKVRDSLNEKYILKTAVKQLTLRLKTYSCEAGLYDLRQQTSTICYEYVKSQVLPIQGATAPMTDNPSIYQQLLNGRSFQFSWLAYADYLRPTGRTFTVLACPLVNDQGVIGDLWLYKASEEVFEEAEIWLVEQVASQCAIALRQARLYQNAQKQVKELQRLNYLKDDFLSTISHELRSPICNIQMATQMLEILFKPMEIETQKTNSILLYIQILKNECQREINLINDLLDLSRLNAETDPLALTEVNFSTWIDHVIEPFQRLAQKQQQVLQIRLPASLPPLTTDLSYLKSILNELLSNACKYTPSGETIVVSSQALPDYLEISISNSGVEIPTEEINHVFEKFYRVPSSDPWKHGGVGLGLALVKKRIEQIQSIITVNSSHGWTTFTLQLPWKIYDTPQSYMSRKDEL